MMREGEMEMEKISPQTISIYIKNSIFMERES